MNEGNVFDLLFGAGPALREIYKLGFMPKEEDLLEMTPEQYEKFYENEENTGEKVYLLLPSDPSKSASVACDDGVIAVTESDVEVFRRAWNIVENYCKKHDMEKASDEDKLACAAAFLPSTFTEGTKFEKYHTSRMFPVHTDRSDEADNG